jgi:2-oxoacid:acceptor oxidoreductase, alpha subunit
MTDKPNKRIIEEVVIRFSGDSGDGMQLTGTIFSDMSAMYGNSVSTFPDYPAEIRAPQGTLAGVSGFQVHIGHLPVHTPGDYADVLVAMNAAALKVNVKHLRHDSIIIIDSDSFTPKDLEKALYKTEDPIAELGLNPDRVLACPISSMVQEVLKDIDMDAKGRLRCKNMFALGIVSWLFDRPLEQAEHFISKRFAKKEIIRQANIAALHGGYSYGANTHAFVGTPFVIEGAPQEPGTYIDVTGNKATAFGLIAGAERAGLQLFLGSYPITPATDVLHFLAKYKSLGVITMQAEDEIAGICTAIGASYAGLLGVTSTSGPGIALKSEAINLAVIAELPLVVIDVQRGGPSTGMPTKSEQTDLLQAMYGRNGESPLVVIAPTSPSKCFDAAYQAVRIAVEHMTPVILLSDAYLGNGSVAWRIPDYEQYPEIKPPYVSQYKGEEPWMPYFRNPDNLVRYWSVPGAGSLPYRTGGLEKDNKTGAISTDGPNHELMVLQRYNKIQRIAEVIPPLSVEGDIDDAELLIVGWGSTYGHLDDACLVLQKKGYKVAHTQFTFINPMPKNTIEVMHRYPRVVVVEQNLGHLAMLLRNNVPDVTFHQYNQVQGQPLMVEDLVSAFEKIIAEQL